MKSKTSRLDRFISRNSNFTISDVRFLVAQRRITIDGVAAHSVQQLVKEFTRVELDGCCLQAKTPIYMMLHKPKGVVSATKDAKHTTVVDLINHPRKTELHIVGRLDFNTTGLVLLTNDGTWSRQISLPESKLRKVYEVTVSEPLNNKYVKAFEAGIYLSYENVTTLPSRLEIVSEYAARLSIIEGKYHQVKRMFGYFQNNVTSLHRRSVGPVSLGNLALGESRPLSFEEIQALSV